MHLNISIQQIEQAEIQLLSTNISEFNGISYDALQSQTWGIQPQCTNFMKKPTQNKKFHFELEWKQSRFIR